MLRLLQTGSIQMGATRIPHRRRWEAQHPQKRLASYHLRDRLKAAIHVSQFLGAGHKPTTIGRPPFYGCSIRHPLSGDNPHN